MSRLVDPTICPDCRGPLDATARCTACGLHVTGPLATELWSSMVTADGIIERLRVASPDGQPTPADAGTSSAQPPQLSGGLGVVGGPVRSRRLPALSVPVVLLSLGALCLLVAAVVFVAVTWSVLGLTGRTLVLLGVTTLMAVAAVVLTRRALRGAAETFWLIVAGMLALDLTAAESAGLAGLDALDWRGTGALVGVVLGGLGIGVGIWARRQPVNRLLGIEAVAVAGAVVLCATNAWGAENLAVGTSVAIPLLVGAFLLLRRAVPVSAYGLGGLGALSWLVLLGAGWERSGEIAGLGAWWADVRGWPLIVAAAFAAVSAQVPTLSGRTRSVLAGTALFPLVLLANGPTSLGTPSRDLLIGCATVVALAAVAASAPRIWSRAATVLAAAGAAGLALLLMGRPWDVLSLLDVDGGTSPRMTLTSLLKDAAAPWTAGVVALALVVSAAGVLRHVPRHHRELALRGLGALAPAVLALGSLVLVLELEPPLWAGVLTASLAAAVAGGAAWSVREVPMAAAIGSLATAYLTLLALYAASAAHLLTALVATVLTALLVVVSGLRERVYARPSAAIAAGLAGLAGGWALLGWGQLMGADDRALAVALAGYAALVGLLAAPVTRQLSTRVGIEISAALVALVAVGYSQDEATVAMAATIVGSAICVIAVSNRDRAVGSWVGTIVLGLATVLRVASDVRAPELYTLPAALLVIAAGAWQLRSDPATGSFRMLGSGLVLGLVPSLLLALDEPVSLRGGIIGAAGVLVLAAGVSQRLAAPFALGALTTAVLAVRHLEPYAEAVPRWVSLGTVGLALLLVGITWEARRQNVHTAQRYLTALR